MRQTILYTTIVLFTWHCSSLKKKESPEKQKKQYILVPPNQLVEKYPKTFNLKGKGAVILPCGSSCSESQLAGYKDIQIKSFAKDGIWEEYFEKRKTSGEKYSVLGRKGKYVRGKREGEWLQYYETGEILYRIPYQNGEKNGVQKKYKEDGTIFQQATYKNGKRHGKYWRNSRKGYLAEEGVYQEDKKDGLWTEYHGPGKLKSKINYLAGKRHGKTTTYHENGQKANSGSFAKGLLKGHWSYFYDNGRLERDGDFKIVGAKAKRTGLWKKYYRTGDLFSIGEMRLSKPKGVWTFYGKGKVVRARGLMANNEFMLKQGEIYDERGLLWGKGILMTSLIKLNTEEDKMETKFIPNYPFTYYKNGNRDLVVKGEDDSGNMIAEIYSGGVKIGEGPISDARLRKRNGCWTINGKKTYYLMGKVKKGTIAKMNNCE
ncbi:MAG: LIC20035 family adhesin [Spirochaetota bacterium]